MSETVMRMFVHQRAHSWKKKTHSSESPANICELVRCRGPPVRLVGFVLLLWVQVPAETPASLGGHRASRVSRLMSSLLGVRCPPSRALLHDGHDWIPSPGRPLMSTCTDLKCAHVPVSYTSSGEACYHSHSLGGF